MDFLNYFPSCSNMLSLLILKAKAKRMIILILFLVLAHAFWMFTRSLVSLKEELLKLNITSNFDEDILIYNRVPKTGSQTINHIIEKLHHRNNFSFYTNMDEMPIKRGGETTAIPNSKMRQLTMNAILKGSRPFVFAKHQFWLNFSELENDNIRQPIYINFVRHPVDRLVSWYYYIRATTYQLGNYEQTKRGIDNRHGMPLKHLKMSLDDCISTRSQHCNWIPGAKMVDDEFGHDLLGISGSHISQMAFFCGNRPECNLLNGKTLLNIAKQNLEKYFAVVGVLENMDKSIATLEQYIPKYFSGASSVYRNFHLYEADEGSEPLDSSSFEHGEGMKQNVNMWKPMAGASTTTRTLIARILSNEIEFYHYCRQRLTKQYLTI